MQIKLVVVVVVVVESTIAFLTGQSWRVLNSWYTGKGQEQGFRHRFADGLNQSLVSSLAQANKIFDVKLHGLALPFMHISKFLTAFLLRKCLSIF